MKLFRAWLTLVLVTALRSDIARVYPSGKEPAAFAGSAAAEAAQLDDVEIKGKERAHTGNANLAIVTDKAK